MGKYEPLKTFLLSSHDDEIALSFDEIERLIGAVLPPSQKHPAWWSNNPANNPMTRVWLDAGYRTEGLDLIARKVTFRRTGKGRRQSGSDGPPGLVARLQSALGGTVRVQPGFDLTEPTGEVWDAQTA
jgi:hypothetical protein